MAEANEPPADAVRRELREELGLDLDERTIASLRLMDDEVRAYDLFDEGQVKERLRSSVWRRVSVALDALTTGRARYLQDGYA